jgi:hypothetical protein
MLRIIYVILTLCVTAGCQQSKPNLTERNLDSIIPIGMTESNVYRILGTNAIISHDNLGRKDLTYFFPYAPPPPEVNPKIDTLDIFISNGVVVHSAILWNETYHKLN